MKETISDETWKDLSSSEKKIGITEGDIWVSKCDWCKSKGFKNEEDWLDYFKGINDGKEEGTENVPTMIKAKFSSNCVICKEVIKTGETVAWWPDKKGKPASHDRCYSKCEFVSSCTLENCHTRIEWLKTHG